jgi:ABC-2 type transport system ATP-binding protein
MSAWENLQFFSRLYRIPEAGRDARLTGFLRSMQLWDRRDDLVGTFSKGMKQKLAIIRAIFHDPKVIFFDEPTSGLDPEAAHMVREMISRLKHEGRTIVVCTHNLDEAARLADLVGIIRGRLLLFDTLAGLQAGGAGHGVVVDVELAEPLRDPAALQRLPGVRLLRAEDSRYTIEVPELAAVPRLTRALVEADAGVIAVRPRARDLESIYLQCIQRTEAAR